MGKNHRADRLGGEIKKILGEMLINGIKDPRLTENMVSISGVTVTSDGSYAYCYVNIFQLSKEDSVIAQTKEDVLSGLNSAKGIFKKEIAKAVKIRRIPELIFKIDEATEYGQHIDSILSTIDFDSYHAESSEARQEEEDE